MEDRRLNIAILYHRSSTSSFKRLVLAVRQG
jgi:hypothetical protein